MLTSELIVTVPGKAATKGSMKCIGRVGKRAHVLIEDHKSSGPWRETLTGWLRRVKSRAGAGQPIGAEVTFTLPRPAAHYGTGRNATRLRDTAPTYPVGHNTGDVDKLLRLVLDALQDVDVLPDDCAVVEVTARKAYPVDDPNDPDDRLTYAGVRIRLYPIEGGLS